MEYNKEWEYGAPSDCDCQNNFIEVDCGCKSKEVCECENILLEISKLKSEDVVLQREIDAISGASISGVTEEEVDAKIASAKTEIEAEIPSLSGYATENYVNAQISSQTSDFVTSEQLSSYTYDKATIDEKITSSGTGVTSGDVQTMIDSSISGKTDNSIFRAHTADTTVHVTSTEKTTWNSKANVWCGSEADWALISGGTLDSNTIYLVY